MAFPSFPLTHWGLSPSSAMGLFMLSSQLGGLFTLHIPLSVLFSSLSPDGSFVRPLKVSFPSSGQQAVSFPFHSLLGEGKCWKSRVEISILHWAGKNERTWYTVRPKRSCQARLFTTVGVYIALVFQLIPQNRYKLNKKCRRLAAAAARDPDNQDLRRAFAEIKVRLSRQYRCI